MRNIFALALVAAFALGVAAPAFAECGAEHTTKTVEAPAPSPDQIAEKPDGK